MSISPARSPRNSEEPTPNQGRDACSAHLTPVHANQPATTPEASVTQRPDAHEQDTPASSAQFAPQTVAEYAKPPPPLSTPATVGSVGNDLLTIAHASSDAFPPLKSVLGGNGDVLEPPGNGRSTSPEVTPRIINHNSNSTSVFGNGSVANNNWAITIMQNAEEQVRELIGLS